MKNYSGVVVLVVILGLSSCASMMSMVAVRAMYDAIGVSSTKNVGGVPETTDADLIVGTLAGDGKAGLRNGPGMAARFRYPTGITVDSLGTVFVADTDNRGFRRIESNGEVSTPSLMPIDAVITDTGMGAGSRSIRGIMEGIGSHLFVNPIDVIVGPDGYFYMVAFKDNRIWRVAPGQSVEVETKVFRWGIDTESFIGGRPSVFVGEYPYLDGNTDGNFNEARFRSPQSLAIDSEGNIYVADTGNHRIRKITTKGMVVTFAGGKKGFKDGAGDEAQFSNPIGIAVDASGNVYVADKGNHSIRKITAEGVVSTLAGNGERGFMDGNTTEAQFSGPSGVAVDLDGNIYVADQKNNLIRKITPEGMVSTYAGSGIGGYKDGNAVTARFRNPYDVAVDLDGNVYVADTGNHRIRMIEKKSQTRRDMVHANDADGLHVRM